MLGGVLASPVGPKTTNKEPTLEDSIQLMLQYPTVHLFKLRHENKKEFFIPNVDSEFVAPRLKVAYRDHAKGIQGNNTTVDLPVLKIWPDIKFAEQIHVNGDFSPFSRFHLEVAARLTKHFTNIIDNNYESLKSHVAYIRDRINPRLFFHSLSIALAHSKDKRARKINADFVYAFPKNFFTHHALEEGADATPDPYILPKTGTYLDEEYRVAYFREDVGLNSHHSYWHLVYPFSEDTGPRDRRGELFFFMHQQLLGRYNCARLSATLSRVESYVNFGSPIHQGYYSKLQKTNSYHDWPGRSENVPWKNINRPGDKMFIRVTDMTDYRMRIEAAIDAGHAVLVHEVNSPYPTYKKMDIDVLGNMIESSVSSPNPALYGSLHNNGHLITAFSHDPDMKYAERMGVMGETSTAIRDPVFFRWHSMIDDIFQKYKNSKYCPAYEDRDLKYDKIEVKNVKILSSGTDTQLHFNTFWAKSKILVNGMDLKDPKQYITVAYTHLDQKPFKYEIEVINNDSVAKKGTVRIFLAPKFDENKLRFELSAQRRLFVEMDKFVMDLKPGPNTTTRDSTDSAVTIPLEQQFPATHSNADSQDEDLYCKCGLPQNLLVPKGTATGAKFQLFVMVSDYNLDHVPRHNAPPCKKEGFIYCGLKDDKYPDSRSMGYPFDRQITDFLHIEDFIKTGKNMWAKDVTIIHDDSRPK